MKIYGSKLFALYFAYYSSHVWDSALGFVPTTVPHQRHSSSSHLMSSQYSPQQGTTANTNNQVQNLEQRLANLEQGQGGAMTSSTSMLPYAEQGRMIWENNKIVRVQGGSLRTWSYTTPEVQRVQVILKTEGRPLEVEMALWDGPDNTPVRMKIYTDDGTLRPFMTSIETPGSENTIAIRNHGPVEFPMEACVVADPVVERDGGGPWAIPKNADDTVILQGGAVHTFPFDTFVQSAQVFLKTDGRPLRAKIELLQGPGNDNQIIDLYTEDGIDRPFYMVVETPGSQNVVRIVNTAPVEFPLTAWAEPYHVIHPPMSSNDKPDFDSIQPVIGGGPFDGPMHIN